MTAAVSGDQVVYLVGGVEFLSREEALDAVGDYGLLTEATGASSRTVSVRTERCPTCGTPHRIEGVTGMLALMSAGRPCGCDATASQPREDEDAASMERQEESARLDLKESLVDFELNPGLWWLR